MAPIAALFRPAAPGFWLILDLLLGAALWLMPLRLPQRWASLGRVLRWVALPYLALLAGALSPQKIGLAGIDWEVGLTLGLGIVLGILALLALVRLAAREPDADLSSPAGGLPAIYSLLYHGAEEFHWCFQRAALLAVAAAWPRPLDAPEYWAIWGAALLALPGIWTTSGGLPRLYKGITIVASAILFFYTRNFWLCWALHAGIMLFAGPIHVRPELQPEHL